MLLELLADLGADGGYGHVQGVHGLDLGGLFGSMNSMSVFLALQSNDSVRSSVERLGSFVISNVGNLPRLHTPEHQQRQELGSLTALSHSL